MAFKSVASAELRRASAYTGERPMLDSQNKGPCCMACDSPMKLMAIEPSALDQDLRTFSCPTCKRVERHIIDSAVTEAWLEPMK